ncbi:MAG: hypothetical protein ACYCVA_04875 [Sulfobacillus sp.]
MWVAFLSVGGLYASAEGHAVILVQGHVVWDVTPGVDGVRPGMKAREAELAAPGIPHLSYEKARHDHPLAALWHTLQEAAPVVAVGPDLMHTAFLAWPGNWPGRELALIQERYPTARIGVATNRLVAKAVLPSQPGMSRVAPGEEAKALSGLPIRELWILPKDVQEQLLALGLETAGEVAAVPQTVLVNRMGQAGYLAARAARGLDNQEVHHLDPTPELTERRVWIPPCRDHLAEAVTEMAVRVATRLPAEIGAKELTLVLDGHRLQRSWPAPIRDIGRIGRTAALLTLSVRAEEVEEATVSLGQLAAVTAVQERLFGPDQTAIPELADVSRGVEIDRYDAFLRRYDPLFGGSDGQRA